MLVNLAATRLVASRETQSIEAQICINAVTFGGKEYIYTIFVLNLLIVVLCCYQVAIERAWSDVAPLDFTDVADVALDASKGGKSLFNGLGNGENTTPGAVHFLLADAQAQCPSIVFANTKYTDIILLEKRRSETSIVQSSSTRGKDAAYHSLEEWDE